MQRKAKAGAKDDGVPVIPYDADAERWLCTARLERLRKRGWKGTLKSWVLKVAATGTDPLTLDPPVTR